MKIHFIPEFTTQVWATTTSVGFRPVFVIHDVNQIVDFPGTVTADTFAEYSNLKVYNCQRPWKYYRKMVRNVLSTTSIVVSNRGYYPTDSHLQSQNVGCYIAGGDPATTNLRLGTLNITQYVTAIGCR